MADYSIKNLSGTTVKYDIDKTEKDSALSIGLNYPYSESGKIYLKYEKGYTLPNPTAYIDKDSSGNYVLNDLQGEDFNTYELGFEDYIYKTSIKGALYKTNFAVNVPEAELEAKLIEYQDAIAGFQTGFLYDTQEYYLASLRRTLAAPFAADEAKVTDIVNEETGECVLKIGKTDFSGFSYDDLVLAQRKLIAGNLDKIYINEDGTLTVESTSTEFGVSKYIYQQVK